MTARPGQWELLGEDSDPLAGDSVAVTSAARHYTNTADQIRDQVTRLRRIAEGTDTQLGKYVEPLKDSAKDLADHLAQAQGRFDTVAHELNRWAPVLEHAHTETGSLLRQAEDAQHDINAHQPPDEPVDKDDDEAKAADKKRANKLSDAKGELGRVKKKYDDLMNTPLPDGVKAIADDVAKKIDDASHDKLKNRRFDGFRKWVHDHAGLLKLIADVLTWIATAIAILGGGWLLVGALLLGALLIHTLLALQGDGSWADVALDAFAIATLGAGELLAAGARTAFAMDEGMTAFSATKNSARMAFSEADGFFGKTGAWFGKSNIVARNIRGFGGGVSRFSKVLNTEFEGGFFRGLIYGDRAKAGLKIAIDEAVSSRGSRFFLRASRRFMKIDKIVTVSGLVVDASSKTMNSAFPSVFKINWHAPWIKWINAKDPSPFKPPWMPSNWSEWIDSHTVTHGGYPG